MFNDSGLPSLRWQCSLFWIVALTACAHPDSRSATAVAGAAAPPATAASPERAREPGLKGRLKQKVVVIDAVTRQPLDKANVTVWYLTEKPPAAAMAAHMFTFNGNFEFSLGEARTYIVGVEMPGYAWLRREVALPVADGAPLELALTPQKEPVSLGTASVSVRLDEWVLHDGTWAVPGWRGFGAYPWSAANAPLDTNKAILPTVDVDGHVTFPELQPGLYELGLAPASVDPGTMFLELKPGQKLELDFRTVDHCLAPASEVPPESATIQGKVTGIHNPERVTIVAWKSRGPQQPIDELHRTLSRPDGSFVLRGLSAGHYKLTALEWDTQSSTMSELDVRASETTVHDLSLVKPSAAQTRAGDMRTAMTFKLVDRTSGEVVHRAAFQVARLFAPGPAGGQRTLLSDERGRATEENFTPGLYAVEAWGDGYFAERHYFELTPSVNANSSELTLQASPRPPPSTLDEDMPGHRLMRGTIWVPSPPWTRRCIKDLRSAGHAP